MVVTMCGALGETPTAASGVESDGGIVGEVDKFRLSINEI
jgi:hypothetical protein